MSDSIPILLRVVAGEAPAGLLADEVTFASPFADYHGRADVAHLFGLIAQVMREPVITGAATDGVWTYTALTARAGDHALEAVLRERRDATGRLAHGVLVLRPYRSLRAAMDAMGRLLAQAPLPSAR